MVLSSPHDLCGRHFGICGLLCHRLAPCADELQPCGFCFLLFDAVVTEAQQAGYRAPGVLQLKPEGVFISLSGGPSDSRFNLGRGGGREAPVHLLHTCCTAVQYHSMIRCSARPVLKPAKKKKGEPAGRPVSPGIHVLAPVMSRWLRQGARSVLMTVFGVDFVRLCLCAF